MTEFANLVGLIGVAFILLAYFLLQLNKITPLNWGYPLLNLLGALMILFSLGYDWNLPAVLMESAWALVSIFGLIQIRKRRLGR